MGYYFKRVWHLLLLLGAVGTAVGEEGSRPWVVGRGAERFQVGKLLYHDDFHNLSRWTVQLEEKEGFPEAKVITRKNTLDCFVPGRGCTV